MDGMLDAMTPEQFMGWIEYALVEPFGEEREDFRMGQICAVICNVNRDAKRVPKPFQASDFMPKIFVDDGGSPRAIGYVRHHGGPRQPLTSVDDWKKSKASLAEVWTAR